MDFKKLSEFYNGKKVLLTGHTGFKGSYMTVILGLMGAKVYGYALKPNTVPCLFDILYGDGVSSRSETELTIRTSRVSGLKTGIVESRIDDILNFDALTDYYNRISPDIVIHMAAQPLVRESYRIPRDTYEINVMGTVNLLECIRNNPCCASFLNVTTDKVYFNEERPGYGYRENDKLDGFDPYSNSKSCSELVTHSYAASFLKDQGVAVSTARAGNVIGGGDFSPDRIIPDCVRAAVGGKEIVLRNLGSIRPYQHVLEPLFVYLTIAMEQALDPEYAGWYNVGPDREDCITTGELCELFVNEYGGDLTWTAPENSEGPHEAGLLMLDNSKLKETFSWEPVWHMPRTIKAVCDWTKAWQSSNTEANEELLREIIEYGQQFK
ncbi:MAG: CDP-glucose 4,6-dehydratase [Eubacteriales bacterium]|nr:CDP-glucose 4,6-dehydratase [Eubacteriales bacterium]